MAIVALLGGDRRATIEGAVAMLLGPLVYWISKQWNLLSSSQS